MYHIAFYVPAEHVEKVKENMFQAGAGKLGNYDKCAFEYKGTGQFQPLKGSDPFIGTEGEVEKVEEIKVEMICQEKYLSEVVKALIDAHPYETPAYYVIKTVNV